MIQFHPTLTAWWSPSQSRWHLRLFLYIILDHVNIPVLISHKTELQGHLDLNAPKAHLLALNETHLQRGDLSVGGYCVVARLDRRDGRSGGGITLLAVPEVAPCITLLEHAQDLSHERSWFAIHADLGAVLLCVWYRPPCRGEIASIQAFEREWSRLSPDYLGSIVVGDLNVHHTHWLKHSDSVLFEGSRLRRFCVENGFRQLFNGPTHEAGNLLDLCLTDLGEVESCKTLPRVADHNVIRLAFNLAVPVERARPRTVFDYKTAPWHVINERFLSTDWSWISCTDVDTATRELTEYILHTLHDHIQTKIIYDKVAVHPW